MPDSSPRILLLDDEPLVLRALQFQLHRFGFEVETLDRPDAALATLKNTEYDALICDNNMPSMTGIEFLISIRNLYPSMKRFILLGFNARRRERQRGSWLHLWRQPHYP